MKSKLLFVLLLIAQVGYSQGFFSKAIAKVAKKVGGASDQTSSTLTDMVATAGIGNNLHPSELGTISQSFFTGWKPGGDLVFVMFTKKSGTGFYKIDGTVTVNGQPAEYLTMGSYNLITEANPNPRKVEIATTAGQKASFTIEPAKNPVKLVSINGQKDNISLDLTKDVTIELDTKVPANTVMKVSLAINQVSIKSIYDVCYVRSGSTIVIPAAAFRNINITPAGNAAYGYKKSFLQVNFETLENATDVTGDLKSVQYNRVNSDGKFVTVTTEPVLNTGLNVKGTNGDMTYDFFKANAFLSRPFDQIKKVGVISFSVRGTSYHQVTQSTSTSKMKLNPFGGASAQTTKTTITVTKEFPWETLLEKLYPEFVAIVESEFGASVLAIEKITGSEAYKSVDASSMEGVEYARSFRNTKVLSAFMSVTEGYGSNGVNQRIMNETGADALMTLTLDLATEESPGNQVLMLPKLGFEIVGKTNGVMTNTKYCVGNIISTNGSKFNSKDITPDQLESIVNKADLLASFRKGLQELKAKEKANGDYPIVWKLQE